MRGCKKFLQAQGELHIKGTGDVPLVEKRVGPGCQGQELYVPFIKTESR